MSSSTTAPSAFALQPLESRQHLSVTVAEAPVQLISSSSETPGNVIDYAVDTDKEGNFAVAYRLETFSTDQDHQGIFVRRYDKNRQRVGTDVRVTDDSTTLNLDVALADNGRVIVSWLDRYDPDNSASIALKVRRYDSSLAPLADAVTIDPDASDYNVAGASIDADADGDFAVQWTRKGAESVQVQTIIAQSFDGTTGASFSSPVTVLDLTAQGRKIRTSDIRTSANGDFVVFWHEENSSESSTAQNGLYTRAYSRQGAPKSEVIAAANKISSESAFDMEPDGDYIVGWRSSGGDNPTQLNVKHLKLTGETVGSPVTFNVSESSKITLAAKPDGSFLVGYRQGENGDRLLAEYSPTGELVGNPGAVPYTKDFFEIAASDSSVGNVFYRSQLFDSDAGVRAVPFTSSVINLGPLLQLTAAPTALTAGVKSSPFSVTLVNAEGETATTDKTKLTLSLLSGPTGAKLSGKAAPKDGVAKFSPLTLTKAGTYSVRFAGGSFTPIETTFTVNPAAPSKIVLTQVPASLTAGAPFTLSAQLQDKYGNLATNATTTVTLALASKPKNASPLAGLLTATPTAGLVTFSDLSLTTPGKYSLALTGAGLKKATSKKITLT